MVRIRNCVVVLSLAVLAACVTTADPEPVVLTAQNAVTPDGDEKGYEIVCKEEEETGSRLKHTVCRIVYPGGSAMGVIDDIHKADRMQEMANSQRPKER